MPSRSFGSQKSRLSHRVKPGSELYDLREDVEAAFDSHEGTSASLQTAWFINTTTGNDSNSGAADKPLKTVAEFSRRLRSMKRGSTYVVDVTGSVPATDTLDFGFVEVYGTGTRPLVIIRGQKVVLRSGTFSAINNSSATTGATGTQASCTATGATWTPGEFIYATSGAAVGRSTHVMKDLGSGVARTGHWAASDAALTGFVGRSNTLPSVNDTFDVVTFNNWAAVATGGGDFQLTMMWWKFTTAIPSQLFCPQVFWMLFRECHIVDAGRVLQSNFVTSNFQLRGCCIGDNATQCYFAPSGVIGTIAVSTCTFIWTSLMTGNVGSGPLFQDCSYQRTQLRCGNNLNDRVRLLGENGFFDWTDSAALGGETANGAVYVGRNGTLAFVGAGNLYGSGGNFGVSVRSGGTLIMPANTTPRLGGSVADIDFDKMNGADNSATAPIPAPVGGNPSTWSASKSLNGTGGAGWGLWETAFGRSVFSYKTGAKMFSEG